jgi:flagellar FliJ protein
MGFQFKLEAVRKVRQFEEDRTQREFAEAQRNVERAEQMLSQHISLRARSEADFQHHQAAGASAAQAAMYRGYLQRLADEIEVLKGRVESALSVCEEKRNALMAAMKKRKALDRLKEQGEQAFLAELNSEEQKFISEMAINRHLLKNR